MQQNSPPVPQLSDSVFTRLRGAVGPQDLLSGPENTERYARDWSGDYSCQPLCVLRPQTVRKVVDVVRICAEAGLPIIPQGGHTGLVGGGTPDSPHQVVLSLERMDKVRAVDPLSMTMTVEAGCILQNAKDAAAERGCLLPLSLGAQGSCQIGGNLSTNAGGLNVLRYGMMRQSVLGLEAVLADGRIFSDLRALRKNNTGIDLKQLFIGSEGTLGIITAATLRLFPQPRWVETLWLSAESITSVMGLYELFQREAGDFLSAFELITTPCLELALELDPSAAVSRDLADHSAHALIEVSSSGGPELRPWLEGLIAEAFDRGLATDGLMAQSTAQAKSLWRIRELMVEAQQKRGIHLRTDVSVPIAAIAAFIVEVTEELTSALPGVLVLSYGHIGDGNVHVNAMPPADMQGLAFGSWVPRLTACVNGVVDRYGGSISAEHGIGISKRAALSARLPTTDQDLMRAIKRSMDPSGLLSPGRILDWR
jgi:FAD/FMN-containing dehydrogenase